MQRLAVVNRGAKLPQQAGGNGDQHVILGCSAYAGVRVSLGVNVSEKLPNQTRQVKAYWRGIVG